MMPTGKKIYDLSLEEKKSYLHTLAKEILNHGWRVRLGGEKRGNKKLPKHAATIYDLSQDALSLTQESVINTRIAGVAEVLANTQRHSRIAAFFRKFKLLRPFFTRSHDTQNYYNIQHNFFQASQNRVPNPNPKPEPEPVHVPEPEPVHVPEPVPVHVPEPVPEPAPKPNPKPAPNPVPPSPDDGVRSVKRARDVISKTNGGVKVFETFDFFIDSLKALDKRIGGGIRHASTKVDKRSQLKLDKKGKPLLNTKDEFIWEDYSQTKKKGQPKYTPEGKPIYAKSSALTLVNAKGEGYLFRSGPYARHAHPFGVLFDVTKCNFAKGGKFTFWKVDAHTNKKLWRKNLDSATEAWQAPLRKKLMQEALLPNLKALQEHVVKNPFYESKIHPDFPQSHNEIYAGTNKQALEAVILRDRRYLEKGNKSVQDEKGDLRVKVQAICFKIALEKELELHNLPILALTPFKMKDSIPPVEYTPEAMKEDVLKYIANFLADVDNFHKKEPEHDALGRIQQWDEPFSLVSFDTLVRYFHLEANYPNLLIHSSPQP